MQALLDYAANTLYMNDSITPAELLQLDHGIDAAALAQRLDRLDVLLLREFYVAGDPCRMETTPYVLGVLVDKLRRGKGPLGRRSYTTIRRRLEHLAGLGLIKRIPQTNPAAYWPVDWAAPAVRKIITLFAADFVGLWNAQEGGSL